MSHGKKNEPKVEESRAAELVPAVGETMDHPATTVGTAPAQPADDLAKLQAEKAELVKTLQRRQADFENYRKRVERENVEASQRGVGRLIEDMLPALDAFERAIAAHEDPAYEEYRKGFDLIYRQFWEVLGRYGLGRIEAEGKSFDPNIHQAVERVESAEDEDGSVVAVLQQGYTFRGKVLRPALVRVAIHPHPKTEEAKPQVN